jgi:hypothetical protein
MQMRGGSIRYQAQNLRRVHIPAWDSLTNDDVETLGSLYEENDTSKINAYVECLIGRIRDKQPPRFVAQEFDFAV